METDGSHPTPRKRTAFFALLFIVASFALNTPGAPIKTISDGDPAARGAVWEDDEPRFYEFVLSDPASELSDHYTRREMESFLCGFAPDFITLRDIHKEYRSPERSRRRYIAGARYRLVPLFKTKYKEPDTAQLEKLENGEINKWTEPRVTVTCRGQNRSEDIGTVCSFINEINGLLGRKKFAFTGGAPVANIVLEFRPDTASEDPTAHMGESVRLEDNMRVLFYIEKEGMKIETYNAAYDRSAPAATMFHYTPEEQQARKKTRIIKIFITNVPDAETRKQVIFHELMHAVGFSGHSPYPDSNLFPYPVRPSDQPAPTDGETASRKTANREEGRLLSNLGRRMVKMLYRPEILPGMTVKEVRAILPLLSYSEKTSKAAVLTTLDNFEAALLKRKKTLLERARFNEERKGFIYRSLNQLAEKKIKLDKELAKENKLDTDRTKDKAPLDIIRMNREMAADDIARLKSDMESSELKPAEIKKLKRQIALRREDLGVWDDIARDFEENQRKREQLEGEEKSIYSGEEEMGVLLRRVVRQLMTIDDEYERLDPSAPKP